MMVWGVGILGFIVGFIGGVNLIRRWLADRSRQELLTNKSLHTKYGLFVWLVAGLTSAAAVFIYKGYF